MKFDNGKPSISLVPPEAIVAAANVYGFGASKYGENNWRDDLDKFPYSRHYNSIMRHMLAWHNGEDIDPESGLPHTHHALTQMMILITCEMHGKEVDDRYNTTRGNPTDTLYDYNAPFDRTPPTKGSNIK